MIRSLAGLLAHRERPVADVPRGIIVILTVALLMQILWHEMRPALNPFAEALPAPVSTVALKLYGLSDAVAVSKAAMLWLQAFDNQPGISIPFRQLDYERLTGWLENILQLDPWGQYPLLAAARIYSEVPDAGKKRQMLEFVYQKFLEDPEHRWPALAHAVYVAKHRLKDLPLAYRYAEALATNTSAEKVPFWVREMRIYVLEDMGEIESARVLIGGLIESGTINDANELRFLTERLKQLEELSLEKPDGDT